MTTLNIRVDEELKRRAAELFADLGLDMSSAVNMFLRQAVLRDGLPFEVKRTGITYASDEDMTELSKRLIKENAVAYKRLAE